MTDTSVNFTADPLACLRKEDPRVGCAVQQGRENVMAGRPVINVRRTPKFDEWRISGGPVAQRSVKTGKVRVHPTLTGDPIDFTDRGTLHETIEVMRAAYSGAGTHTCAGKSLYELVWEELDQVVERIMAGDGGEAADGRDPGRAEGLAIALAIFKNPYLPNWQAIRDEAMERWEQVHGEDTP